MLKVLLKKQLGEIFRSYFYDAKKNRARSKAATAAYIVLFVGLMVGVLGGMFTYLSLAICRPLMAVGMEWLYFALLGGLSVLLGVFGSVFNTFSSLYLAKDNDLLLSMPIPVPVIMASRLLSVYLMGLMYSGVILLPAVIVYWIVGSASVGAIVGSLLLLVLVPIFVLTLSCALGWVVAKVSLKLKNKSFITVLISLVFLGGYYFFYFKAQSMITDLLANAAEYGAKIKGAAYPVYLFGRVGTGDWLAMLAVAAVVLALFGLMWALISRSFLRIATSTGRTARRVYRERAAKCRGTGAALLAREMGRFVSSPNYMLNCGLGVVLLPVCAVLLLWKGGVLVQTLNAVFGERASTVPLLLCAAVCMIAGMNDMAAPSVSLEGKSLWLVQSLPIRPWQVLRAKLAVQLLLTEIPALLCVLCLAAVCSLSPAELLTAVLLVLSCGLLLALLGLVLGLKMPNLAWTSEITPIKQSGCVLIALFAGMLYTVLLCVGFFALSGWKLGFAGYTAVFAAATLAVSAGLYFWLRKRGPAVFAAL